MAFTLEKLPNLPIVVYVHQAGGDPMQDMAAALADVAAMLDVQSEKTFVIYDIRAISVDLDDILRAASSAARGSDALLHHPHVRENIYVASSSLLKMALKGLTSATFGQVKMAQFDTLEEAMAYCSRQLADNF